MILLVAGLDDVDVNDVSKACDEHEYIKRTRADPTNYTSTISGQCITTRLRRRAITFEYS